MEELRINANRPLLNSGIGEPEGLSALQQARQETDAMLQAAEDVINRILSRDSNHFLQQARQHGGQ